jgi:membrane fusion protein (multidrug efflux system)
VRTFEAMTHAGRNVAVSRFASMVIVCAVSSLLLSGCKRATIKPQPPDATFVTIRDASITPTEYLQGRAAAHTVVDIRPQVNGELGAQLFKDGSQVIVGQPLFQIDSVPYKAAYDSATALLASAEASLELAEAKANRARALLKQSAISKQDYDVAEAAYKQASTIVAQQKANLAAAQFNLDKTTIKSPITGYIGRAFATPGSLVTAYQSSALATVQARDPIYIDIPVSVAVYARLKQAQATDGVRGSSRGADRVTLSFENGQPYAQEGRLKLSNVAFDRETGKVLLRAAFPNPKLLLLPGMNVHIMYSHGRPEDAVLVPKQATHLDSLGKAIVLVIDGANFARRRIVTVGRTFGDNFAVTEGIHPGDRVIVDDPQKIKPDSRVHPVSQVSR